MSTITTKDSRQIYYKDWGKAPVVTFSHGWPLNSDAWDGQMLFLAQRGFRVVAHDRRGHGRSTQTSVGNDMNGYADDLATLIAAVPPLMLKTGANPEGLPIDVFDKIRADLVKDPSQYYRDLARFFYGANRPGAKVSQGILDQLWLWSMQAGLLNAYESIKAFSETDFTEDL